jgi:hypothetical protein
VRASARQLSASFGRARRSGRGTLTATGRSSWSS